MSMFGKRGGKPLTGRAYAKLPAAKPARAAGKIDVVLLVVTWLIVAFGVLMVYSASRYNAEVNYGNEYYFMFKQLIGAAFGAAALVGLMCIDYHVLAKLRYPILVVSFALLALVFVPGVGVENYGARRWINLPFFTLQASEIAKFGFIIFAAGYMARHYEKNAHHPGHPPGGGRRSRHVRADYPRTEHVDHHLRGASHVLHAVHRRRAHQALSRHRHTGARGRAGAHSHRAVPPRPADGVPRSVGVAARRRVPAHPVVLFARQRRPVRHRAVQLPAEIPVPALFGERFHLRHHRRGAGACRMPAAHRRVHPADLPRRAHRAACPRPAGLLYGGRHRRHHSHSGDRQYRRGHRLDTADRPAAAVRLGRIVKPDCIPGQYRHPSWHCETKP